MKSLQGQLLIASPRLMDPNFVRSVVLMVQHGEEGALGLILNRPLEITIASAWEQASEDPCPATGVLYQGGPCEGPLMVVHTNEDLAQMHVLPGVYFSTQKEAVEQLVMVEPGPRKFFVGYAGWGPGQLEGEIEDGGWLTAPATPQNCFADSDELWNDLRKRAARSAAYPWIDPESFPADPSVN